MRAYHGRDKKGNCKEEGRGMHWRVPWEGIPLPLIDSIHTLAHRKVDQSNGFYINLVEIIPSLTTNKTKPKENRRDRSHAR